MKNNNAIRLIFCGLVFKHGISNGIGRTGIFWVSLNILSEMFKRDDVFSISLYLSKEDLKFKDDILRTIGLSGIEILSENSDLTSYDACISTFGVLPEDIKAIPSISCYSVLYDVIPLLMPECFMDNANGWFKKFTHSLNDTDYYFAISDNTKRDFLNYFPVINEQNIITIPLSTNKQLKPNTDQLLLCNIFRKYNVPPNNKYVLSLCSLEPRKNLDLSIRAFLAFIEKNKIEDMIYVLCGSQWNNFMQGDSDDIRAYIGEKIFFTGYVDDEDIAVFYSNAEFFIYTSQYEGFGMPPLEAMTCFCPVITSNNSSLPEVVDNAGLLVDYNSIDQHIKAFEQYHFNRDLRNTMAVKGYERSKQFSWEKTVDVIENQIKLVEEKKIATPKVSVITPVLNIIECNREEWLEKNIQSVDKQTYTNLEHIIIDGSSKDGTIELISSFAEKYSICCYSEKDDGLYDAINKGIKKSTGKYVVILNSDDYYNNEKAVELLVKKAEETSADAVCGSAKVLNVDESVACEKWQSTDNDFLLFGKMACHQTFLIKKSVMIELGLYSYDYKVSADTAFMYKMLRSMKRTVKIDPIIVTYHLGGVSGNQSKVLSDVCEGLFNEYGKYNGLTRQDCVNIIYGNFANMNIEDAMELGAKIGRLGNLKWTKYYFEQACRLFGTSIHESNVSIPLKNKIIDALHIKAKIKTLNNGKQYKVFYSCEKIPLFVRKV